MGFKYFTSLVLVFLIGFTTNAQPYFQRAYGMQGDDNAFDVVVTSDDGYLLAIQNSNTTFILATRKKPELS